MIRLLIVPVFLVYLLCTIGLLVYGLNCYVMLALFARRRRKAESALDDMKQRLGDIASRSDLPHVTTQIAVYNELNVSERVMRAACRMRYPRDKHEIQVLDDSTDETRRLVDSVAGELRAEGHDIKVIRREERTGFKAGALAEGLRQAKGELIAVFDADFVPPEDYLTASVPFFIEDEKLGFAQARWGHLNRQRSLLTRAQSIGIDGHFVVEQIARNWNGLFMNFNGTAGLWRREAIEQVGGWQWDTLTEDLDLSYRVQFAGWHSLYLPNVVVPAELPEDINAFRGQQFRWAKGSVQTLIKLMPNLLSARVSAFKKLQAILHMGGYLVHPMMLTLSLLALPILSIMARWNPIPWIFLVLAAPLCFAVIAPSTMYFVSQRVSYTNWVRRVAMLPMLLIVGVGMALSNTRAIAQAVAGHESEFVRTPKRGDRPIKHYRIKLPVMCVFEVLLGIYCSFTLATYLAAGKFLVGPFLAIYAAGFLYVGLLTFAHSLGWSER